MHHHSNKIHSQFKITNWINNNQNMKQQYQLIIKISIILLKQSKMQKSQTTRAKDRKYNSNKKKRYNSQNIPIPSHNQNNLLFFNSQYNQSKLKLLNNTQVLKQLCNFKKNNNKIQDNIEDSKKQFCKGFKINKKKLIGHHTFGNLLRKCWNDDINTHKKNQLLSSLSNAIYQPLSSQNFHKIIKQHHTYSRYRLFQLYTIYQSILQFTQNDPKKLLHGIQSVLNYDKIMIKQQIIKKYIFQSKQFQFNDFLIIYKKMEDLMFIQNVIDFLQIIFQNYRNSKIKYQTLYDILLKRSSHNDANTITKIIFKKLSIQKQSTVQLQDILQLCQKDMEFCSTVAKLYHHESKEQ